jgi:hypothetical protein
MPQLDQTGPQGLGPKTGRGDGSCTGNVVNRFGCRRGRGLGFGCRRFISPKNELVALEEEEKALEEELALIKEEKAALKSQEQ